MANIVYTYIARVSDNRPLVERDDSPDADREKTKKDARDIVKRLNPNSEQRCSIESGQMVFHYVYQDPVVFLCQSAKSYPRKMVFTYLEELAKEFMQLYQSNVDKKNLKVYEFQYFDTFIQRTQKNYENSQRDDALSKLNVELQDVTRIMTKNMEDLLWRGDSLDRMSHVSGELKDSAKLFKDKARHLNLQALYRKYGPPVMVASFILLVFLIRYYWM